MYPLPDNEVERIVSLKAAHILDSNPSPEFDDVVTLVRDLLDVPICVVSLVDTNRQWFKAKCGLDVEGTSRDVAFCTYAILSDEVFVIEDATTDPRFNTNPLVTGFPNIRFYAGAPLIVSPGVALGTLCAISSEPRNLSEAERSILQRLAGVVAGLIRGHGLAHDAAELARKADEQSVLLEQQARELRLRERRFIQTEKIARVGGWELDLATNEISWSDETYRIYDIPVGSSVNLDVALSAYPTYEQNRLTALLDRALNGGGGYDEEFEFITATGSSKWVRAVGEIEFHDGRPRRIFGTFQDVTERHRVEQRLWEAANRNSLTGLANRNQFDEMLAVGSATRTVSGLLMVDADHLKDVNDTLGHDAGDELIRAVSQRLLSAVGDAGTVARVGGDEFAVLLRSPSTVQTLDRVAQSILSAMEPRLLYKGSTLKLGVSIGGAIGIDRGGEELRQSADLALYHAKEVCRGGYVPYQIQMRSAITVRTAAVNTIDEALASGDVIAWYQPVVELATGRITGLEALARVRRGSRVHSIGKYAGALQDRRTAARLTACMLGRIEHDVAGWRQAGIEIPQIAINVGALDFQEGAVDATIMAFCKRAGLPPSGLAVEVTESVFLARGANVVSETAARLRSFGVVVALDDFGTGHASLAHLATFPVDVIKMDRSFVMRMTDGGAGGVIAAALIDLAHRLDMKVIAEGVEDEAQLDRLIALGCEKVQGFLFSRPMPPAAIADLIRSSRSLMHFGRSAADATRTIPRLVAN